MVLSVIDSVVNWFNGIDKTNLVTNILFYGGMILSLLSFSGKVKDALTKNKENILNKLIEKTENVADKVNNVKSTIDDELNDLREQLDNLQTNISNVNANLTNVMKADPLANVKYGDNIKEVVVTTTNNINKGQEVVNEVVEETTPVVEEVKEEVKTTSAKIKTTSYIE